MRPVRNPVAHPTAAEIAEDIRAELVCCDIFHRLQPVFHAINAAELPRAVDVETLAGGHQICFWGEAAARIAESHAPKRPAEAAE